MKPFLILQLRPESEASDDEFQAILLKGGLQAQQVERVRLDINNLPHDIVLTDYSGIIVGGGPGCISDPADKKSPVEKKIEDAVMGLMPGVVTADFPFLGCCYGMGILGHFLAPGSVSKEKFGEPVGAVECHLTSAGQADPLLAGVANDFRAFVGHKEAVQDLPEGAVHLVASGPCPYQMIRTGQNVYATQFHPEADSDGFVTRIHIYKDRGYFPPETANDLIKEVRGEDVTMPELVLRNFVNRYQTT